MLFDDDFSLDGVRASSLGIVMQSEFKFDGAEPEMDELQIAGRSGTLHIVTGAWKNIKGTVDCYLAGDLNNLSPNVRLAKLGAFLKPLEGYQRLTVDSDSGYYRMAMVRAMPEHALRLGYLAPFTITFDCKPQHYLVSGDTEITATNGGTITNLTNQTAYPIIRLTGSGAGTVTVNGSTVSVTDANGAIIDSELMKGYTQSTGDLVVSRGSEFPVLKVGSNGVTWSGGITGVFITPRWYEV